MDSLLLLTISSGANSVCLLGTQRGTPFSHPRSIVCQALHKTHTVDRPAPSRSSPLTLDVYRRMQHVSMQKSPIGSEPLRL